MNDKSSSLSSSLLYSTMEEIEEICGIIKLGGRLSRSDIIEKLESLKKIFKITQNQISTSKLGGSDDNVAKNGVAAGYDIIIKSIRPLLTNKDTLIRSCAFRTIRYMLIDKAAISTIYRYRVYIFLVHSLEREPKKYLFERMQTIKLIRRLIQLGYSENVHDVNDHIIRLAPCIIKSIIAVIKLNDKSNYLRHTCLEVLREIAVIDSKAVAENGGIKVIMEAIVDPTCSEIAESLILTVLYLVNLPQHRNSFRQSLDISLLLAPYMNTENTMNSNIRKQWLRCKFAIVTMMKTWAGLMLLTSEPLGLRSLVHLLVQPVAVELRLAVLETILEVFITVNPLHATTFRSAASSPPSKVDLYFGVGPGAAGSRALAAGNFHTERAPGRHMHTHTLLDNFMAVVIVAFLNCGLLEALIELGMDESASLSQLATQLLSFILRSSARLLPDMMCRRYLSLRKLVDAASDVGVTANDSNRAQAQRAAGVVKLLSRIVGVGYDNALSTLLSRSTYDDGISLASELSLVSSLQKVQYGIFPRSFMINVPSYQTSLDVASTLTTPSLTSYTSGEHPSNRKRKIKNFFRKSKSSSASKAGLLHRPKSSHSSSVTASSSMNHNSVSQASITASNRGHRTIVSQLVMENQAHGRVDDLMYNSKVLSSKDWARWDWNMIDEIISGPCQNAELCLEAMKTKFFKRVCGFFRMDFTSSYASYITLPWSPDHIPYTNVAINTIRTLLSIPEGITFLTNDRRGKLLFQFHDSLLNELQSSSSNNNVNDAHREALYSTSDLNASFYNSEPNDGKESPQRRLFTSTTCKNTMVCNCFVLVGVYTSYEKGLEIMREMNLFSTFTKIAMNPEKDYLSRLIVANLDYDYGSSDAPNLCRQWLEDVVMSHSISNDLKLFIIGFLRALMRNCNRPEWILNVLYNLVVVNDSASNHALSVLMEASHYPVYLNAIINFSFAKFKVVLQKPTAYPLLLKYVGSERGLALLQNENMLDTIINNWIYNEKQNNFAALNSPVAAENENIKYVYKVERALTLQMSSATALSSHPFDEQLSPGFNEPVPRAIPVRAHQASAPSEPGFVSSDLQSLYRVPWNIEVWAVKLSTGFKVRLPMETFVDCSSIRPENQDKSFRRNSQAIRVTGVPTASFHAVYAAHFLGSGASTSGSGIDGYRSTGGSSFNVFESSMGTEQSDYIHHPACVIPDDVVLYAVLKVGSTPVDANGRIVHPPIGGGAFPDHSAINTSNTNTSFVADIENSLERKESVTSPENPRHSKHRSVRSPSRPQSEVRAKGSGSGSYVEDTPCLPLSDAVWSCCTGEQRLGQHAVRHQSVVSGDSLHFGSSSSHGEAERIEVCSDSSVASFVFEKRDTIRREAAISALSSASGSSHSLRHASPLVLTSVDVRLDLVPHRSAAPSLPDHLYGLLAKTESGVKKLRSTNEISKLSSYVSSKFVDVLPKRAALWGIGHIASSIHGLNALLDYNEDLVKTITEIALHSDCLSLRGTAIYALGLVSHTAAGCERLRALNWDTLSTETRPFARIALPHSLAALFHIDLIPRLSARTLVAHVEGVVGNKPHADDHLVGKLTYEDDDVGDPVYVAQAEQLLAAVCDLSNSIAQKDAYETVMKLKDKNIRLFRNPLLLLKVQEMLGKYTFVLWVRQFLMGLFYNNIDFSKEKTWKLIDSVRMT